MSPLCIKNHWCTKQSILAVEAPLWLKLQLVAENLLQLSQYMVVEEQKICDGHVKMASIWPNLSLAFHSLLGI